MGFTFKGRKGYDNIAPGSATGEENHCGLQENFGGGPTSRSRGYAANYTSQQLERIVTSDQGTTGQASFWEKHVALSGSSTTDSGWYGAPGNLETSVKGGGPDLPGSTSNTSWHTSGTTYVTQVFPERIG